MTFSSVVLPLQTIFRAVRNTVTDKQDNHQIGNIYFFHGFLLLLEPVFQPNEHDFELLCVKCLQHLLKDPAHDWMRLALDLAVILLLPSHEGKKQTEGAARLYRNDLTGRVFYGAVLNLQLIYRSL